MNWHNKKEVRNYKTQYMQKYRKTHREQYRQLTFERGLLMRLIWDLYKSSEPCLDCGKSFPAECMDFDHVRGIKKFAFGSSLLVNPFNLQKEVEKCDLVCAICHRIRTRKRCHE